MEVSIEWTKNKHAYARPCDDGILLRIPHRLPEAEKQRVIQLLLQKVQQRKQHTSHVSVFEQYYQTSTVTLWNGDMLGVSLVRKRTRYALTLEKTPLDMVKALSGSVVSRSEAQALLLAFIRECYTEQVAGEVLSYARTLGVEGRLRTVCINNPKTKWGSAHADGTIRISLKTLLLPAHLFRYVCAHEVVHLRHMNHSPAFWNTLEGLYPGAKEARKEMKHYRY
jgi:predicted metal-dependent hydrolase